MEIKAESAYSNRFLLEDSILSLWIFVFLDLSVSQLFKM